jgi:hypothetical protein
MPKKMKLQLKKTYSLLFILLLTIEILIAKFLTSGFIRYTFGDYLAVILLYCFFRSFINANALKISFIALIIAYIIEFLQLINVLSLLNIQDNHIIKIILGSTFNISDLVAYTLGILSVLIIEYKFKKYTTKIHLHNLVNKQNVL